DPRPPAMALGDVLDESKTDATAADRRIASRKAHESFEDAPAVLGRNARACIDHVDAHRRRLLFVSRADADFLSVRGVLQRVVDEVDDRKLDRALVDARPRELGRDLDIELHAL